MVFKEKFLKKIDDDDTKNAIDSNLTAIGIIILVLVIGGFALLSSGLELNNSLLTNFGFILLSLGVSYPTISGLCYIFGKYSHWKLQKELLYKCSQPFIMIYMSVLNYFYYGVT